MLTRDYDEILNGLFEELVPMQGKAATVAGELVRAACKVGYRFYNDGDHLGIGYGKETVNPAGRYLIARGDLGIASAVSGAWGIEDDEMYEGALDILLRRVVNYILENPALKETANEEDMLDFAEEEDNDDTDDEDWEEDCALYDEDDDFGEDYYEGWD